MGFLSGLFGGGGKTTTNIVQTKIPEELSPHVKEVLGDTQTLYRQRLREGFDPYTGQRISGFMPEQEQAQAGIRGLVGTQRPIQEEALGDIRAGGERFDYDRLGGLQGDYGPITQRFGGLDYGGTPTEFSETRFDDKPLEEYMGEYRRGVTDIEKREAQKAFEQQIMPQFEKQAIAAGGMSGMGSRAGVQAGLLGQAQMQQLGDIEKRGLQESYQDAQQRKAEAFRRFQDQRAFEERGRDFQERERQFAKGERQFGVGERGFAAALEKGERDFMSGERTFEAQQFANQKARERQRAADLTALAPQMFKSGMAEMGALEAVGAQRAAKEQDVLDKRYAEWLEEKQFPEEQLARYTSSIYGNPMLQTPTRVQTKTEPSIPFGQQLLGFGTSLMGLPATSIFGKMAGLGGKAGGGYVKGLSGLSEANPYVNYMQRKMGGTVYRQNSGYIDKGDYGLAPQASRELEPLLGELSQSIPRKDVIPTPQFTDKNITGYTPPSYQVAGDLQKEPFISIDDLMKETGPGGIPMWGEEEGGLPQEGLEFSTRGLMSDDEIAIVTGTKELEKNNIDKIINQELGIKGNTFAEAKREIEKRGIVAKTSAIQKGEADIIDIESFHKEQNLLRSKAMEDYFKQIKPDMKSLEKEQRRMFFAILGRNIATNKDGVLVGAAVGIEEAAKYLKLDNDKIRTLMQKLEKIKYDYKKENLSKIDVQYAKKLAIKHNLDKEIAALNKEDRDSIYKMFVQGIEIAKIAARIKEAKIKAGDKPVIKSTVFKALMQTAAPSSGVLFNPEHEGGITDLKGNPVEPTSALNYYKNAYDTITAYGKQPGTKDTRPYLASLKTLAKSNALTVARAKAREENISFNQFKISLLKYKEAYDNNNLQKADDILNKNLGNIKMGTANNLLMFLPL
tara:strand:+ start:345 stop:3056 length:2712 start_codon:yes stop_codon:yes gene_type:complete